MSDYSSSVLFEGKRTVFKITNVDDHIQKFHSRDSFYEPHQLAAHRRFIPMNGTVIDIGANIGNHTLFYATHTRASLIYPLEPNREARELLQKNLAANPGVKSKIRLDNLAVALGRASGYLERVEGPSNNLGATHFRATEVAGDQAVACVSLDDLSFDGHVAFMKIDVEGMELDVLDGAERMIAKFRPVIAIEINETNEPKFWTWIRQHSYQAIDAFLDYVGVKNYIVIPTYTDTNWRAS